MIKRVLRWVYYLAVIFLVLCALSVLYQRLVKRADSVSIFGFRSYIVLSGSMEPTLQVGDLIVSRQVGEEQVAVGDIITFQDADGLTVTHRVANIIPKDGETLYQTKGDHNNVNDVGLISIENIRGKYLFKIGGFGKIATGIASPAGLVSIVFIVGAGYVVTGKKRGGKSPDT